MGVPDFMVIGAMKCGTSTLHEQLASQRGVFMSTPKEPCFFSDDDVYGRGIGWYDSLFESAPEGTIRGESSTHSTKLPDLPRTVERVREHAPDARFVYVMRHPVDRLVSHYVHDWTERKVTAEIDDAVRTHTPLVNYGLYAMQLAPWIDAFGPDRVLPVFFESMTARPQHELERVARFIGLDAPVSWREGDGQNVSSQRLRKGRLLDVIMHAPGVSHARRALVPRGAREWVKNRFFRLPERPQLNDSLREEIEGRFDEDLEQLSRMLGLSTTLACSTFKQQAAELDSPAFVSQEHAS